jgi:hypothetical protein
MAMVQGNPAIGDESTHASLTNGQLWLQKTTGWWQFYIQAGAYDIPALGVPFLQTDESISDFFGPVPVAYLKLNPGKNTSILVGALPTLMGAEYTFTFQNMNIERGLLWDQENAVNRGIQINQTMGKFTGALSWNDGYYSNRYSWFSGALTYASGPHSVAFEGMGNMSHTKFQTPATPIQNNGTMYALIYTYTKGSWIIQPYAQYSTLDGASTRGGALLLNHTFKHGFSLAGRVEYLSSTGTVDVLFGPGSNAWSFTATPTYQYKRFFARSDLSLVHATDFTPGVFRKPNQPRAVIEAGVLF